MISGHTPGPWKAMAAGVDATMVSTTLKSGRRASFRVATCKDGDCKTAQANARLIAAAPDMLTLLKRLRDSFPGYIPDFVSSIDNVIAKAEGRLS